MCKALVKRGKFSFLIDFNISTIQNFCRELGCEVSGDAAREGANLALEPKHAAKVRQR